MASAHRYMAVLRDLATGHWIESKLNVILVGTHAACLQGRHALYASTLATWSTRSSSPRVRNQVRTKQG